mgnify:CR=1 FL=1
MTKLAIEVWLTFLTKKGYRVNFNKIDNVNIYVQGNCCTLSFKADMYVLYIEHITFTYIHQVT